MNIKRFLLLIVLVFSLALTGCSSSRTVSKNRNDENDNNTSIPKQEIKNDVNENNESISEDEVKFDLNVNVRSRNKAIVTISGINEIINTKNKSPEDQEFIQINFDEYFILIGINNSENPEDYFIALSKFAKPEILDLDFPKLTVKDNCFEFVITMPEGEADLNQINDFELLYCIKDKTEFYKVFEKSGMKALSNEAVFLTEVYDQGFIESDGDAKYFKPSTDDYVIYELKRNDDGPSESHLMVEFDEYGYVKSLAQRIGIISGQKSGRNGPEPVYADEEIMRENFEGYKSSYGVSSAAYEGHYIYLNFDANHIEYANNDLLSNKDYKVISTKEYIQIKNTPRWQDITYIVSKQIFSSKPELTEKQRSMPQYCNIEDFKLYKYDTFKKPSDDFLIRESQNGEEIVTRITYFDEKGNGISTLVLVYKPTKATTGLTVHPDSTDVYYRFDDKKQEKLDSYVWGTRMDQCLKKKYSSYQDAINAGEEAQYYSNPVLK